MNTPLDPSPDFFTFREFILAGDELVLINPKKTDEDKAWNKENLHYRSVIVRKSDNKVVSASWPKFFNVGQSPALYPDFKNYNDWQIENKEDGSTIIISKYKGELICRTRGAITAFEHPSSGELKEIFEKNPYICDNTFVNSEEYSLLFEHLSVQNQIVIKYNQPELILIGVIQHSDYKILESDKLDEIAALIGVKRPQKFNFGSLQEIIESCCVLKNAEGYVISYNSYQNRVKAKGDWYLSLHRLKSELSSFNNILDLFFQIGRPNYTDFWEHIRDNFDFELAEMVKDQLKEIVDLYDEFLLLKEQITSFVKPLVGLPRKDAAALIIKEFWKRELNGIAFILLDGRELHDNEIKKMILKLRNDNE